MVAAGAVVSPNAQSPERRMAVRVRDAGTRYSADMTDHPVLSYRQRGKRFRAELRRLEV